MEKFYRRIAAFFTVLLVGLAPFATVCAAGEHIIDDGFVLTEDEANTLRNELSVISEQQGCDVVIVTVEALNGASARNTADSYYSSGGYRNGILFLLSIEDREWYITTGGFGITAFTDEGQRLLMSRIQPYLAQDDYYSAFSNFARVCNDLLSQVNNGKPYDVGSAEKGGWSFGSLVICLLIGAGISLVVMLIMKSSMKTVRTERAATVYVRQGSFKVTGSRDSFLYKNVTKNEKQSNSGGSTTHTTASGQKRGGSGGKF